MNNSENDGQKPRNWKPASNSFGDLIHEALGAACEQHPDYERFRTTYVKEEYRHVFPRSIIHVKPRPIGALGTHKRDFLFAIGKDSICFARNLWFSFRFFSKRHEVERFLKTANPEERRRMFERRLEELKTLSNTYSGWLEAGGQISGELDHFEATKTDLLTVSKGPVNSSQLAAATPSPLGSAAVGDLIREVEQRATYQAGNPEDACEKALYFLALGRLDIAQAIAGEVLAENPDNAVALYANAVLLLDASERHQRQALIHDIMHPHDLPPIEAEEQYHADRHADESLQAWEKESGAFILMLKARRNWPKQFSIRCYDLDPSMWQNRVEEWILRQAAFRLTENSTELCLHNSEEAGAALKMLQWVIADIRKTRGRSFFHPIWSSGLGRFIIVAAHVNQIEARACLKELEAVLEHPKPSQCDLVWRQYEMELPIPEQPTLAEMLIPTVRDSRFWQAVFAMMPITRASTLLRRITQAALSDEYDRRTAMRSLMMRVAVLNLAGRGCFDQAIELCREMAERSDWPATETGQKLQACWRYGSVVLHFKASRIAFEANDTATAAKHAGLALELATDSLAAMAGKKPLLKSIERDEDGVLEFAGDFLFRQPNVLTDTSPTEFFPPPTRRIWIRVPHNPCWNDFVKWSKSRGSGHKSLLLNYCLWLAQQHSQNELLLPKCDAFAARLASLGEK